MNLTVSKHGFACDIHWDTNMWFEVYQKSPLLWGLFLGLLYFEYEQSHNVIAESMECFGPIKHNAFSTYESMYTFYTGKVRKNV